MKPSTEAFVRLARYVEERVVLPSGQRRHVSSHSPCEHGIYKTINALRHI